MISHLFYRDASHSAMSDIKMIDQQPVDPHNFDGFMASHDSNFGAADDFDVIGGFSGPSRLVVSVAGCNYDVKLEEISEYQC